eukprot:14645503-Alexandrium_andersonii.AAC.1
MDLPRCSMSSLRLCTDWHISLGNARHSVATDLHQVGLTMRPAGPGPAQFAVHLGHSGHLARRPEPSMQQA